jgi:fatty acid desaturase
MIWLRHRILVFTGYACLFCLFVLIPFGVILAIVWLFGWLRNPFQWLILGGVVIWAVWRFPAQVHKFILAEMRLRGFPDLRDPKRDKLQTETVPHPVPVDRPGPSL